MLDFHSMCTFILSTMLVWDCAYQIAAMVHTIDIASSVGMYAFVSACIAISTASLFGSSIYSMNGSLQYDPHLALLASCAYYCTEFTIVYITSLRVVPPVKSKSNMFGNLNNYTIYQ